MQESNRKAERGSPADALGSRLRSTREAYGISLRELARRVGLSASLISQIETGKVHPSVSTLYALATELDASVDELLFEDAAARAGKSGGDSWGFLTGHPPMEPVQRTADRQAIELQSGVRWERLTSGSVPGIDFLYIVYEPGGESAPEDAMQQHAGREWGYIIEGTLHVTIGFDDHVIGPGDAIAFASTTPHRLYNEGPEVVRAVWYVLGWQSGRPAPSS